MNKANLKSYAPKARLDFIKAVTERANVLGISAAGVVPAEVRGDVALIDGREWPAKVASQRDELIARIARHGFEQTMDEVAYTWFNRFAALRYMEIHDYLGHGWRVLSSHDGGLPEILRHATEMTLPGLNPNRALEMQLAGNHDNELYKLLLVAQCNELSRVMPFLFERIDDETELLLPENLLRTDSIVATLVEQVPEEDWQEIEVIGWLYQFYISEKKAQVIGKVVKSEDIPAATQLFTPNWIVQYLVQNSVGRLWLMANPGSTLASQWSYYVQPADQTPEVQAQLDDLIQTRIREDGETLNPETITVLDPACGSGHILVVAYDVLKAMYLERGYQPRSIPRLILEKNLYGLDIDDRAAQLAAFALLMKARADDRRLFSDPPKLNVLSLRESRGLDVGELERSLVPSSGLKRAHIKSVVETFTHAKTYGSLIQIPAILRDELPEITSALWQGLNEGDLYARQSAKDLFPLVAQSFILGMKFDALVANPPYMGGKYFDKSLKSYVLKNYQGAKGDLYACFMLQAINLLKNGAQAGIITIPNWMFLSSFEEVRHKLILESGIMTFVHNGRGVFGSDFGSCSMTFMRGLSQTYEGRFLRLFERDGSVSTNDEIERRFFTSKPFDISSADFEKIPGAPIAYWATNEAIAAFVGPSLGNVAELRAGITTGDNDRFVRQWQEVDLSRIALGKSSGAEVWSDPSLSWIPLKSGGEYRKWYGNNEKVLRYDRAGYEALKAQGNSCASEDCYFRAGLTWSDISGYSSFGVRRCDPGFAFTTVGHSLFAEENSSEILGFLCSNVAAHLSGIINPTIHANPGDIARLPYRKIGSQECVKIVDRLVDISRLDWDGCERSWNFLRDPVVSVTRGPSLKNEWNRLFIQRNAALEEATALEERNNEIFISEYGMSACLSPAVPNNQISLTRSDRQNDCQRLISYAIGCMMGRYSLNETGVIYAHAGNVGFDPSRYEEKFPADTDGIVPLTDESWFEDAAASRVYDFVRAVWGAEMLEENMAWLAESLGTKGIETPDETVRRYLAEKFFKDHLQIYKKRPIYWLFSSGTQGAFQALVYLHRYNEGTLARIRAEYVMPLIAKMMSRLETLDRDVIAASSAAARTKLQKQIEALRKKQIELMAYDEKLRHYADMRITLDLDNGVKVNYAKFGDLVAESKAITGGGDE